MGHDRDRPDVIVALDVPGAEEALRLAEVLAPATPWVKVGLELFTAAGPGLVEDLAARGHHVFLDLKFHDIPHTAFGAARSAGRLGARIINVHAAGGRAMMARALEGAAEGAAAAGRPRPLVLAVTVLTSLDAAALRDEVGTARNPEDQVVFWAQKAQEAGLDGVVCSPREAALVKAACGPAFVAVTPGVRPAWSARGDQSRVATPLDAARAGADYLVVGRPITHDPDPLAAARRVLEELKEACGA